MNNKIYCSTGTMVGRDNGWNHRIFIDFGHEIEADGFELMMVKAYYEKLDRLVADATASGLFFGVIHAEKDIGLLLGGEEDDRKEALRLFRLNCSVGAAVGAEKIVLHLWSGKISDTCLSVNLGSLEALYAIAAEFGLLLLIENVPCVKNDPISNLTRVAVLHPGAKFVYDLRFGAFHEQNEEILSSGALSDGSIDHVHLSDYVGPPHDFASLRPILHLGQGIIGLSSLLPRIALLYHGTITLESPEILATGCGLDAINRDLAFIRRYFGQKTVGAKI